MGRNSGGTRPSIENDGGGNYQGKIAKIETLKNIQNKQVYSNLTDAISKYHSALGVRQKNIKLAELERGVLGVHQTSAGESAGVFLNSKYFKNSTMEELSKMQQANEKAGFLTQSNRKGFASTIQHELAHATWNNHLTAPNAVKATGEITKLAERWQRDKTKKGYGKYAESNVNEFFAEVTAKAVSGNQDKYTRAIKKIIKKYKL